MSPTSCAVCSKPTILFNYGVLSCSACKMFFRRALCSQNVRRCIRNGACSMADSPRCSYCRFQQCLRAGMRCDLVNEYQLAKDSNGLSTVIRVLSDLDVARERNVVKWNFPKNLTLQQLLHGYVRFPSKPLNLTYDVVDWGYMESITSIDFVRKLEFMKHLTPEDSEVFIKDSFIKWCCFSIAWRNFIRKRDVVQFHSGCDVFPDGTSNLGIFSPDLLSRVRSRLIGKFCELKISREEYLLVGAALFCNPAIAGLSISAQNLISPHQQKFTSALLQHCLLTYQHSGPSRFNDLLSLCTIVNDLVEDISSYFLILHMSLPQTEMRQLYIDLFKFIF